MAQVQMNLIRENLASSMRSLVVHIGEDIARVEAFIDQLYEDYHIREEVYGNIMVSVTEAVNNGLFHGNGGDPNKSVIVSALLLSNFRLLITVEDQGPGFDYEYMNPEIDHILDKSTSNTDGRGFGLFLMKCYADEFSFVGNGNKVELIFNI